MDHRLLVLRLDPVTPDLDESTTHILQHIKWATSKGPRPTAGDSWQQEMVLDVSTQVPRQNNACGLIVLQYHLILGTMLNKRPDVLHGPQDTLLAYLVEKVIPTLRTVNRGTTANYYYSLREGVKSGSWQANAMEHRLWPEDGTPPRKASKAGYDKAPAGCKADN